MSLTLNFEAVLDEDITGVDALHFGLAQFTFATDGDALERRVTLPSGAYTTLDTGSMTGPFYWLLLNVHDNVDVKVGFGSGDPIVLEPGELAWWSGTDIAYAIGDGAESRLLYWVIKK